MTDPLALLPLATAARGGRVDAFEAGQLVAAGLTLLQRSAPLVRALAGQRAAILLPSTHRVLVALAAAEGRGAVLVNPLAAPPEIDYQCANAGVGAAFTVRALAPRLPDGLPVVLLDDAPRSATVVIDGTSREIDLGSHVGLTLTGDAETPASDEEAALVYTSAMAGTPLGAVLTHRNLLVNAWATLEAGGMNADDHSLVVLPLSHLFGLTVAFTSVLLAGGRITTLEKFSPARVVEILHRDAVTVLVGVPAVFAALLPLIERRGGAPHLRLCICGGAPLDPALQERWRAAAGADLRQGYGLTEAAPVCLFNRVSEPNVAGTIGTPLPGVEVAIHDPASGAAVPPDTPGEIRVRGENVFAGYLAPGGDAVVGAVRKPQPVDVGLTVDGGWLRTGDLGTRRDDGRFTFEAFLKPMFTRNGFNIYPREIERAVRAMAGVRSADVRPVPSAAREHDIALTVIGEVREDAVRAWCEARLSAYKQPTEIVVRAD